MTISALEQYGESKSYYIECLIGWDGRKKTSHATVTLSIFYGESVDGETKPLTVL
jgi:hypothetical protein